MSIKTPITIAHGDGIGPEIMEATLAILEAAGATFSAEVIEVGEKEYHRGNTSGIPLEAWNSLKRTKVFLKAPITTPQGGGVKSLNVTIRKTLGLYANVRPCRSLAPYVPTFFPTVDLVIVRENEEDLYAGIEYQQTHEVFQCLKLISRSGCERICHYAFEYAKKFNRKKVTCMTKDNIMKMTDGIFHEVFDKVAKKYPSIETEHLIIDIGTALIATHPERFDVIVTSNLYGDIISDVAAQVVGSVGMAGSANIGDQVAMFEAIHGSAPDIAGKDVANPSGLLNGAVQMLIHINQPEVASRIENAWLTTLEDGIHTGDIFSEVHSKEKVGTKAFTEAVIARLGKTPSQFPIAHYPESAEHLNIVCVESLKKEDKPVKNLVGVDVYLENESIATEDLAESINRALDSVLFLQLISSRGVKIWPEGIVDTVFADHCRCRFIASKELSKSISHQVIIDLLGVLEELNLDVIKTENLYTYDGVRGFTLAQGE
jgi:isocitrate dehydrogenase